ncbi:MAG: hypothetical protein ACFFA6_12550 [Promethearchaeota archaeon]
MYLCPRCGSKEIIIYEKFIECKDCNLEFDKKFIGVINNGNILARQEIKGFIDTYDDIDDYNDIEDEE